MLWVPTPRPDEEQDAPRVLPLPVRVTTLQPEIEAPLSVKLTLPDGAVPVTVALKVTLPPTVVRSDELARLVVLLPAPTDWNSVGLFDPTLLASPEYAATMHRVPAARVDVEQLA